MSTEEYNTPATNDNDIEIAPSCVLDFGTGNAKVGFGGDEAPRAVFKNMIGKPRPDSVGVLSGSETADKDKIFVGEEAYANSGVLSIIYAIEDGLVTNEEAFKAVAEHAFSTELRCNPSEYNVLLTEAPNNALTNSVFMMSTMFNDFNVPAVQNQVQAVLSLYASGRTSGTVLDLGDGVCHAVPVFKGFGVKSAVTANRCAGKVVSTMVMSSLNKHNGINLENEPNGLEIARDIKEAKCRVAMNFESEMEEMKNDPSKGEIYEFKDGKEVTLAQVLIEPANVLYQPRVYGYQVRTLPEVMNKTLNGINMELRKTMYQNTVLSGGTTCIMGFQDAFTQAYKLIVPKNAINDVNVTVPEDRKYSVFAGGSILVSLVSFQKSWIMKSEYEEHGDDIFEKRKLF